MKSLTITLNPREWVESWAAAIRNTLAGIGEALKNPRLWIGITLSFVLHGALLLFTLPQNGKAVGERVEEPFVIIGPRGNEHPKVTTALITPETRISGETHENVSNPLVTKPDFGQASTELIKDATSVASSSDQWQLVINKDLMESTESILSRTPIDIGRSTGGEPVRNPLIAGSEIDITDIKPIAIGQEIIKPGPANNVNPATHNNGTSPSKGSSYILEGDLAYADIVSTVMPVYPQFARARGLSNVLITVEFFANSKGEVSNVMVVKRSSGFAEWDVLVKQALAGWKFKPSNATRRFGRITFQFVLT